MQSVLQAAVKALVIGFVSSSALLGAQAKSTSMTNPYVELMQKAAAHAKAHGAPVPVLSPVDVAVLGTLPPGMPGSDKKPDLALVPMAEMQAMAVQVVPWTTNDPGRMRALMALKVDGIISDRPDLLRKVVEEARAVAKAPEEKARLAKFDLAAHRGGRGLRPENTLPSFENGMDQGATTLETDTGVSTDHESTIWHDQFYNPQSCRRADGKEYTLEQRVYLRDISSKEAQAMFVCDKLHFASTPGDTSQTNDLALSPVSVAFAKKEGMSNPYAPTYVAQLFRFVRFYAEFYTTGAGKDSPHAAERAHTGATVRFNIETKSVPEGMSTSTRPSTEIRVMTVDPQTFVSVLCGTIMREHMQGRSEVQSFDFRTLVLVEEQFPKIPTYYLTEDPKSLGSDLVPVSLRAKR